MDEKSILERLLKDLVAKLNRLSNSDLKKIGDGTHEITIKVTRIKTFAVNQEKLSCAKMKEILEKLGKCESREEGHDMLSRELKNKKELESLAKYLDVLVLKQDKIDQIKDKITEATVGARLRSKAIQGKEYI